MTKMNLKEFGQWAASEVRDYLPEDLRDNELKFGFVTKHSRRYYGMFFRRGPNIPASVVDLDMFYDLYCQGTDEVTLLSKIAEVLCFKPAGQFNIGLDIMDYKNIRDKLFIRVSNKKNCGSRFDNVPTTEIDEFVITYSIRLTTPDSFQAAVLIDNDLLDHYGISKEKLHRDAVKSSSNLFPACYDSCFDIMEKVGGGDFSLDMELIPECIRNMIILSDKYSRTGSAVMFYPHILEKISTKLKGDYILFPYSEKCSLAFPARYEDKSDEYISFANSTYNPESDGPVLSQNFYYFDAVSKNLSLID
ncbi:hypothetical protein SAMN02910456_00945 [Ruminococcaceae bacterium YRB3002]|nr:hypothetical protein SAMN02910456_00945 [Ruminococcaceae bacterium YRB3002]